jgi:hypothetical protein
VGSANWFCSYDNATRLTFECLQRQFRVECCPRKLHTLAAARASDVFAILTHSNTPRPCTQTGKGRPSRRGTRCKIWLTEVRIRAGHGFQPSQDGGPTFAAWNERQTLRAPMIFSPTIGAAIRARYWFLWVRCPACRSIDSIDLRRLDRHPDAAVTSLIPSFSCRSCRPNAPFAELVRLSRTSIADEMREERRRRALGE